MRSILTVILSAGIICLTIPAQLRAEADSIRIVTLPAPVKTGEVSVEEALTRRRSHRAYSGSTLTTAEISQILWAAQGKSAGGKRTAPSAGGLYPLELYLFAGRIEALNSGVYHYNPDKHTLELIRARDLREELSVAALKQQWVKKAPAVILFAGNYSRTAKKYGLRARRYVHIEVGHAAQNVYLQATALGLGAVMVGAFNDQKVRKITGIKDNESVLALMPLGRKNTANRSTFDPGNKVPEH